jgi:hypothetical protein
MKLEFGSERVGFPLPESIMRIRERVLPARVEKRQNRVDQRVANPRVLEPQARTTRFGATTRPCRSRACLLGSIHRGPFRLPTLALKQAHARPSQNLGQAGGESKQRSASQRHISARAASTESSTASASSSETETSRERRQQETRPAEREQYRRSHRHPEKELQFVAQTNSNTERHSESSAWSEWFLGRTQGASSVAKTPGASHSGGGASSRSRRTVKRPAKK